jgi:hypothetical protein
VKMGIAAMTVFLVLVGTPASAQQAAAPTPVPLASAIAREAARLGAQNVAQVDTPRSDWSQVRQLTKGTEVLITLGTAPPTRRYIFSSSESEVVVLNITDPGLPADVRVRLAEIARHPESFGTTPDGQPSFRLDDLRVGSDGVFLGARKVAAVEDIVERMARDRVVEVRKVSRNAVGRGVAWGLAAGSAVGLGNMLIKCGVNWRQETSSCSNLEGAGLVIFPVFGMLIGGVVGAASGPTVVYTAPPLQLVSPAPIRTTASESAARVEAPAPVTTLEALGNRVAAGDPISVHETNGQGLVGEFSRASATSLRIVVDEQVREISADAIDKVELLTGGSRLWRGLTLGAAVGTGWGLLSRAWHGQVVLDEAFDSRLRTRDGHRSSIRRPSPTMRGIDGRRNRRQPATNPTLTSACGFQPPADARAYSVDESRRRDGLHHQADVVDADDAAVDDVKDLDARAQVAKSDL